jgi:hypothetical protein
MTNQVISKIEKCNTVKEYLKVLQDNFDTVNCKPSQMIKQTIIGVILAKIPNQNPIGLQNVRYQCLNSKDLNEFINIILNSFTLNNDLTPDGKKELVKTTDQILILTRLKEKPTGESKKADPPKTETLVEKTKGIFKRNKKN